MTFTINPDDRPTITYSPLMGQKFARSLMRPIPLAAIFALLESGYPADVVMRICIQNIQGLQNCRNGYIGAQKADPAFHELLDLLRKLKDSDAFTIRTQKTDGAANIALFFKPQVDEATAGHLRRVRQLLNLNETRQEFRIVRGGVALNNQEIAILSRSIMQVMMEYAAFIDVPPVDISEGRVYAIDQEAVHTDQQLPPLISVRNSAAKPERPYVAVPYRDRWFWIDDRDIHSKALFYFLMVLFSLTERDDSDQAAPIISVPTN